MSVFTKVTVCYLKLETLLKVDTVSFGSEEELTGLNGVPQSSHVEVLTPSTSEYDLLGNRVLADVLS